MSVKPWILGLSTGMHNGAACLCHGEDIAVAIQEERLTRIKRDTIRTRPSQAVMYCLGAAGITLGDVNLIVDCNVSMTRQNPSERIEAILGVTSRIPDVIQLPHHLGHAWSAFCTSGFEEATVLVIDGAGSFGWQLPDSERRAAEGFADKHREHVSVYYADRRDISLVEKHMSNMPYMANLDGPGMRSFRSLGHTFSSAALQIFGGYLEAGKVMALAPLGRAMTPVDDFFRFNGRTLEFSDAVPRRFTHMDRWPARQDEYAELAASTQRALECGLAALLARVRQGEHQRLCYAGGVALNSVANHKVVRNAGFQDIYIIPAAEDSGTAIGAAYYGLKKIVGKLVTRRLTTDSLGRSYNSCEIDDAISRMPGVEVVAAEDIVVSCVNLLSEGRIVGWFQGGAEFGPRALGHRSILCDPRNPDAKTVLNSRVKHREAFRPFAPAILAEHAADWFELDEPTPLMDFMLEVCRFQAVLRDQVPAVVHVDHTGRLQTVTETNNERFACLIREFHRRTGVPLIVNTSMNIMGEPIVETPRDALWLLLFTGVDCCVIENRIIAKAPSFKSVLDLVPRRTARGDAMMVRADDGPMRGARAVLDQPSRDVLSRIDGVLSFRAIFGLTISSEQGEADSTRVVGHLFRHGTIDFAPTDQPKVAAHAKHLDVAQSRRPPEV
jgi:carbamoyltransferase